MKYVRIDKDIEVRRKELHAMLRTRKRVLNFSLHRDGKKTCSLFSADDGVST